LKVSKLAPDLFFLVEITKTLPLGPEIRVYFILANMPDPSSNTNLTECTFKVDGSTVGKYSHKSDGTGKFEYNVLAFAGFSFSNSQHILIIEIIGDHGALMAFDYAVYT
jgi:hypothetical protein